MAAASSYTFSNVEASHTITATFAINTYTITVTQGANGVIAPGTTTVNYGATPSFTITPNAGYSIASITADGLAVAVTTPSGQTYQFSAVSAEGSLTATFAINTYTITVTQGANGVIAPGTTTVNYGGSQTFTITPNTGYYIASLTVDGSPVTVASSYTFSNVEAIPHDHCNVCTNSHSDPYTNTFSNSDNSTSNTSTYSNANSYSNNNPITLTNSISNNCASDDRQWRNS